MHPSISSVSVTSIFQYAFLACVTYILAGAPLLSMITSYSGTTPQGDSVGSNASFNNLDNLVIPDAGLVCKEHSHRGVFVLSREPLVVYIQGFLSDEEADELVTLSEPHFTPSTIWNAGQETLNPLVRNSEKARLPRSHNVRCIEDRARTFQGWRPHTFIEKLWSQRYGVGGHYTYHYDWSTATRNSGRVSSFMVYLQANCTGGGTHFPRLTKPQGQEWCRFIECEQDGKVTDTGEEAGRNVGVTFKPIAGNAVFWENMRADGTGYLESWHAGLPIISGSKIGLNIWSWYQTGYVPDNSASHEPKSDLDRI